MKQVVLEFDDEEMELLEEQFKQIQDVAGMETIEDYIYYYQNNLSDKKYIDKDYALRNVEVYIRDNLEGNVDKENIDKIISIIKNIINNIKE